jgi:hypothetical protein
MFYETPFDRNERIRRKWWKFLVVNGWINPAIYENLKVSPKEARIMKKRSACGGAGSQFDYDARTSSIKGYFRPFNPMLEKKYIDSTLFSFRKILMCNKSYGDFIKYRKSLEKKYKFEAKETRRLHRKIKIEIRRLMKLADNAGCSSGYKNVFLGFGEDFVGMTMRVNISNEKLFHNIINESEQMLDDIYFRQSEILSTLIQRYKPQ